MVKYVTVKYLRYLKEYFCFQSNQTFQNKKHILFTSKITMSLERPFCNKFKLKSALTMYQQSVLQSQDKNNITLL